MLCPTCRIRCYKHGKDRKGNQRYRCQQCKKTVQDVAYKPFGNMRIDPRTACFCLRLLAEGNSIRSTERLTRIHRDTILKLLEFAGRRCEKLLEAMIVDLDVDDVQADEIWGFVNRKEKRAKRPDHGDAWTFVGIERTSKLILAWHLGKRTGEDTLTFIEKLDRATTGQFQLTTDGWAPYVGAVEETLSGRVNFAQLIKIYRATAEGERRYSPAECVEAVPVERLGLPVPERICTSHVERNNLTMRMQMRRLTRLTNGFSKCWDMLRCAIAFHFCVYNLTWFHSTIKKTPAMAAGLTDHRWTVEEIFGVA